MEIAIQDDAGRILGRTELLQCWRLMEPFQFTNQSEIKVPTAKKGKPTRFVILGADGRLLKRGTLWVEMPAVAGGSIVLAPGNLRIDVQEDTP